MGQSSSKSPKRNSSFEIESWHDFKKPVESKQDLIHRTSTAINWSLDNKSSATFYFGKFWEAVVDGLEKENQSVDHRILDETQLGRYIHHITGKSPTLGSSLFFDEAFVHRAIVRLGSFPYVTSPQASLRKASFQTAIRILSGQFHWLLSRSTDSPLFSTPIILLKYRRVLFNSVAEHDPSIIGTPFDRGDLEDEDLLDAYHFLNYAYNRWPGSRVTRAKHAPPLPDMKQLPSSSSFGYQSKIKLDNLKILIRTVLVLQLESWGIDVGLHASTNLEGWEQSFLEAIKKPGKVDQMEVGIGWQDFNKIFSEILAQTS